MQREKQVGLGLFVRYGLRVGPAAAVQGKAERQYAAKRCNTNASREVRRRKKLGVGKGMEKKEAEAEVEEQTRIYVGGLGEKVTDDNLAKVFSSLGEVKAVDIVRTKGRSFGYVDFFPSSHKSLSKLFSTVSFLILFHY